MVTARYKYSVFRIGYAPVADASKVFNATQAQIEALAVGSASLNGANITIADFVDDILSFDFDAESSTIDVTTVNSDVMREIPGRPKWMASIRMLNSPSVAEAVINRAGQNLGILVVQRAGGATNRLLSAAVGFGTAKLGRADSGLETVEFELYNVGVSLPKWR